MNLINGFKFIVDLNSDIKDLIISLENPGTPY
jgi:hypothetical protein